MRDKPSIKQAIPTILVLAIAMSMNAHAFAWGDTLKIPYAASVDATGMLPESEWKRVPWQSLKSIDSLPDPYPTRFRMMHSQKGVHVLIEGVDRKVTSRYLKDGEELYLGDVFEVFLHPEPSTPLYFEYEVNAHDRELVLLIPNLGGRLTGWLPWRYEGARKVVKRVRVMEGPDGMRGWSAELQIPYALMSPLQNTPPEKGALWRVNVCRLDYDFGRMMKWSWSPVKQSFHEYRAFRPARFE